VVGAVLVQRASGSSHTPTPPSPEAAGPTTPSGLDEPTGGLPGADGNDGTVGEGAPGPAEVPVYANVLPGERVTRRFGEARGFRDALLNAGLRTEEAVEVEEALGDVMDFRRCRPDDELVIARS